MRNRIAIMLTAIMATGTSYIKKSADRTESTIQLRLSKLRLRKNPLLPKWSRGEFFDFQFTFQVLRYNSYRGSQELQVVHWPSTG